MEKRTTQKIWKKPSSLSIEAPKKYISSTSIEGNVNPLLNLSLLSETPLTMSISLVPTEVSPNPPLLLQNISVDFNSIKLGLTNVNDILNLTSIQESLNLNQIFFQDKIQKQLGKSLDIQ